MKKKRKSFTEEIKKFDFNNAGSLKEFDPKKKFQFAGKIFPDIHKNCGYSFNLPKDKGQQVYLIVMKRKGELENEQIIKIGQTAVGAHDRFISYSAGSVKNRERGTCSTTNHIVSEFFRENFNKYNFEVWLYSPQLPPSFEQKFYEDEISTLPIIVKDTEQIVLNRYKRIFGDYPILSRNNSK